MENLEQRRITGCADGYVAVDIRFAGVFELM